MKQATYFIEQYNCEKSGNCYHSLNPLPMKELKSSLISTANISYYHTIAVFKIYPKVKPMLAHYDNNLNAIIITTDETN